MNYELLVSYMDDCLPDAEVKGIVRGLLEEDSVDGFTEIFVAENKSALVPVDTEIVMVTKALFKEYDSSTGFGDFKVMVALGEFIASPQGFHKAGYCFVTLFLNTEMELITADYHEEYR